MTSSKRGAGRRAVAVSGVVALLMTVGACGTAAGGGSSVTISANKEMGPLSADAVKDLAFEVTAKKLDDVKLTMDGKDVTGERVGEKLVFKPKDVSEGKHTFAAAQGTDKAEERGFELDTTAPILTVDKQDKVEADKPFTLTGSLEGANAVKVDDKDVKLDAGKFKVDYEKAPTAVKVWASDVAGNVIEQTVNLAGGGLAGVRAAHIMSYDWPNAEKRDPILALIKEKKLDTVQLDIKDEDGLVGYDSKVPLAVEAGTTAHKSYDAAEAVKTIHDLGAKVVGRIVAFRDPRLGKWAVEHGKMDYVIQNTSGGAYSAGNYGTAAFTNFANPDVIEYNIALGEEAAKPASTGSCTTTSASRRTRARSTRASGRRPRPRRSWTSWRRPRRASAPRAPRSVRRCSASRPSRPTLDRAGRPGHGPAPGLHLAHDLPVALGQGRVLGGLPGQPAVRHRQAFADGLQPSGHRHGLHDHPVDPELQLADPVRRL